MNPPARLRVRTAPDPHALPRMINYFAQRDLVPQAVVAHADADGITMEITLAGDAPYLPIIIEKMRSNVLVASVEHMPDVMVT
jgi:hypothetical protein